MAGHKPGVIGKKEIHCPRNIAWPPNPTHWNSLCHTRFQLAALFDDVVKHFRVLNRAWRNNIHRHAMLGEFKRPGTRHADHARFGRRVNGSFLEPHNRTSAHKNNPPMTFATHPRQSRLQHRYGAAQVQLTEGGQIFVHNLFDWFFDYGPSVVNNARTRPLLGRLLKGASRSHRIRQIRLDRYQRVMTSGDTSAGNANDLIALPHEMVRKVGSNARAPTGHPNVGFTH